VTNGSIKVVRRDKTVMLLKDSGAVTYTPRAAWTAKVRVFVLLSFCFLFRRHLCLSAPPPIIINSLIIFDL